jgi:hypothetical protein
MAAGADRHPARQAPNGHPRGRVSGHHFFTSISTSRGLYGFLCPPDCPKGALLEITNKAGDAPARLLDFHKGPFNKRADGFARLMPV